MEFLPTRERAPTEYSRLQAGKCSSASLQYWSHAQVSEKILSLMKDVYNTSYLVFVCGFRSLGWEPLENRPSFPSPHTPHLRICACTTTTSTAPTTTKIYELRYNERYFVGWKVLVEITVVTAAVVGISAYSVIVAQRTI